MTSSFPPPSLSSLPPELLPLIAFQLSHLTPHGPPPLLPLLLTCKSFYVSLSPAHNPHFWSSLFSQRFDVEAVKRRFNNLEAREIEGEMRERCLMLRRVKERVKIGELVLMPFNEWFCDGKEVPVVEGPWTRITREIKSNNQKQRIQQAMETGEELEEEELEEEPFLEEEDLLDRLDSHQKTLYSLGRQEYKEDLWRIYLMLLEHDSLNLPHLSLLLPFLSLTFKKDLLLDALRPGYPSETTERSLAVWCGWLAGEGAKRVEMESQSESEERFFVLKPYVFAAHKFDACFAPWVLRVLPTSLPSPSSLAHPSRSLLSPLTPTVSLPSRPSPQTLTYFGRNLSLTSPIISHGACYAFFERIERDPKLVEMAGVAGIPAGAGGAVNANANAKTENVHHSPPLIARHQLPNNSVHGPTTLSGPPSLPPIPTFRSLSPLLSPLLSPSLSAPSISSQHDLDFSRLLCCSSLQSPGLPDLTFKGKWEGIWEGRFSFFDFDSYRDMLSGQIRRLYEGPFGVQPQVWRLEERVVKVRKPREGEGDEGSEEEGDNDIGVLGGRGHILNGGYETSGIASFGGASTPHHHHHYNRSRHQNNHHQNTVGRGASFLPGGGNSRRREGGTEGEPSRKRMRSVKDFKGLGNGKSEGEEKKFKEKEPEEEERYEILLSGTGHSAWGQFILRGRIRSWDGMLILTKEYTPDGRGRWLYRGYLNSDGSIVGRWRDTFTPEELYGYEGTFLMTRRG